MTASDEPSATLSSADRRALAEAKQLLRLAVLTRRAAGDSAGRQRADRDRSARLREFVGGRVGPELTVGCYLSAGTEPGTLETVGWLRAAGVRVLLPVIGTDDTPLPTDASGRTAPHWAEYQGPDQLRLGRHGITEPTGPALPAAAVSVADLIVVPGLAGDRVGHRLGRGAGWYDRALRQAPEAVRVLLLDDDEVIDIVPTEPDDQPVDVIITPKRVIDCRG